MTDPQDDPTPERPAVNPKLVALARGLLEAVVLAIIGVAIVELTNVTGGELAPWAPIGVLALRQLEGLADARIDPTVERSGARRTLAGRG